MSKTGSVANPPFGFEPDFRSCIATPRGAAAVKGQVWQFDLAQADADVNTFSVGRDSGAFANLIASTAAGVESGVFAIALENIAENKPGKWCLSGICDALVQKNSGNIAAGDVLVSTATQLTLDADVTAGARHLAKALESATGPSTAQLKKVWFDGLDGFGVHVS